ncbi:hypothetical protein ABL78_0379 [Leptomonas seymouri]|uniref:IQ calmodulin-binding motif family protein n=1 Tax=Leptomonas seymouri TaxID=5684 RepID=A0A0N0P8X5_LEPSE|nr:hypothetical protein ABL78_0379 [Leptomonas seymouri]|eukprot:KPI90449.1 hypothetical protein ABL78_0379 [Leptomonas seymouri]
MKVGSHAGRLPPSSSAKSCGTFSKKDKQKRQSKSSSHQLAASHSVKGAPALGSHEWDSAGLAEFTRWNEEAMAALRKGDGVTSSRILTPLLPELRKRLRRIESSKPRPAPDDIVVQSWRLVYALTLNNYGCQLRRGGDIDGALQQFELAKEVESTVFGKPSCSTMLNLSAVLLSKGDPKEALKIATECAAAAQDGEPVLFITALHNLAVALGQQSSERSRSAALPTMLQALREAQSALGEQHPTTTMLKEKCGLSSQWINSSSPSTLSQPKTTPTLRSVSKPPVPTAESLPPCENSTRALSSARERARAALYTLSFGDPASVPREVEIGNAASRHKPAQSEAFERLERVNSPPALVDSPLRGSLETKAREAELPALAGQRLPPLFVEKRADVLTSGNAVAAGSHTPHAVDSASSAAASVHNLCLDSAHLLSDDCSVSCDVLEAVLQEPFRPSVLSFHRHGITTLRDLCGREEDGKVVYPSFLRFSEPLPPMPTSAATAKTAVLPIAKSSLFRTSAVTEGSGSVNSTNIFAHTAPIESHPIRHVYSGSMSILHSSDTQKREYASISATAPSLSAKVAVTRKSEVLPQDSAAGKANDCESAISHSNTQTKGRRTVFSQSRNRWSNRAAQRKAALEEEEAYRRKMKAVEEAAAAAKAFEYGLAQVKERTRARAARVIQRVWHQWWISIGQPRRHIQLRRMEELQRRRRDRLTLASATGKKTNAKSRTAVVPPPPSQQHGRIAGYVVPAVVVRCARRWKDRTACVRCAARLTDCAVDARLHEADIYRRVCRVQALWRGALQRLHDAEARSTNVRDDAQRADAEARDYAAMVLQCAYRRRVALREYQRLYRERYSGPALTIQQWLRCTWTDQRQRGVDAPTLRKRHAAALHIQRVWRGYQGRLAFRMRELRLRIDEARPYVLQLEPAPAEGGPTPTGEHSAGILASGTHTAAPASDKESPAPATPTPLPTTRTGPLSARADEYKSQCQQRSYDVYHLREEERDCFHIPLYVETMAAKERMAWQEAIRLRPTDVARRRAQFNAQIDAEQSRFVLERCARVIQRAYRGWNAMRKDASRDTHLLQYSLMCYQQRELGRAVERQQRMRDFKRAVQLYGDTTVPMHEEREIAATALAVAAAELEHPALPSTLAGEDKNGSTVQQPGPMDRRSRSKFRREQEAQLHRDERLLALTHPHNAAHLREGPEECEARLGKTYEHPYFNPYVNEEHRRTLGID